MEEAILFKQTADPTLQRAVIAVNNTAACEVIFKAETNIPRKTYKINPAMGILGANGKAAVEILRKVERENEDMEIQLSYAPAMDSRMDVQNMWLETPSGITVTKLLKCVMERKSPRAYRPLGYHHQDIMVGNDTGDVMNATSDSILRNRSRGAAGRYKVDDGNLRNPNRRETERYDGDGNLRNANRWETERYDGDGNLRNPNRRGTPEGYDGDGNQRNFNRRATEGYDGNGNMRNFNRRVTEGYDGDSNLRNRNRGVVERCDADDSNLRNRNRGTAGRYDADRLDYSMMPDFADAATHPQIQQPLMLNKLPNHPDYRPQERRLSHIACMIPKSPREMGGGPPQIGFPGPDQIPTENYCVPVCDNQVLAATAPAQTRICCAPGDSYFLLICVCVLVGFVVGNLLIEII